MASSVNNSSQNKSNYALAVSHVVTELIKAYDAGDTLNLSRLKGAAAKKYKVQGIPRLADILQALPIGYRTKLWPFLQTKPVRTASGVAVVVSSCDRNEADEKRTAKICMGIYAVPSASKKLMDAAGGLFYYVISHFFVTK